MLAGWWFRTCFREFTWFTWLDVELIERIWVNISQKISNISAFSDIEPPICYISNYWMRKPPTISKSINFHSWMFPPDHPNGPTNFFGWLLVARSWLHDDTAGWLCLQCVFFEYPMAWHISHWYLENEQRIRTSMCQNQPQQWMIQSMLSKIHNPPFLYLDSYLKATCWSGISPWFVHDFPMLLLSGGPQWLGGRQPSRTCTWANGPRCLNVLVNWELSSACSTSVGWWFLTGDYRIILPFIYRG